MNDKKAYDEIAGAAVIGGVAGACFYFAFMGGLYWLFTGDFYWPWDLYANFHSMIEGAWDRTDESFIARLDVGLVIVHVLILLGCIVRCADGAIEGVRKNEQDD